MKRLLLYVHFNKYDKMSDYVLYQLESLRSLFSDIIFISNSQLQSNDLARLESDHLIDTFIQRENKGYDFAAWRDGFAYVGFEKLKAYDSVTVMNDTCFGPLWDMSDYYDKYEADESVDFWGMTNHQPVKTHQVTIEEHLQSYFISFKQPMIQSEVFQKFWKNIKDFEDVQDVIDSYETKYTALFQDAGYQYQSVLNVIPLANDYFHSNFTIHYPHVLMDSKVPFIKVKTFDLSRHLSPYLLQDIAKKTDYPIYLIEDHMTAISLPTPAYLLSQKVLKETSEEYSQDKRIAVHLHTFYIDLLEPFLEAFEAFDFAYDLLLTTDTEVKKEQIEVILAQNNKQAVVFVTGNRGRDIIPMLRLKEQLAKYDYIGHFHTKKSPEYPYWVGDSWRDELFSMLIEPANNIIAQLEQNDKLGLVIADIPSFFRYTKIVDAWNESHFADDMNDLWHKMSLKKAIDFKKLDTFIMSYGTFIWFKYDALKPLFELDWKEEEIPAEPLPQHTVLHAIERILVYLAWANDYDYDISPNPIYITPFVDNVVLNTRSDLQPNTYVNFDNIGGIKGALKYIYRGPGSAIKYIIRRLLSRR